MLVSNSQSKSLLDIMKAFSEVIYMQRGNSSSDPTPTELFAGFNKSFCNIIFKKIKIIVFSISDNFKSLYWSCFRTS